MVKASSDTLLLEAFTLRPYQDGDEEIINDKFNKIFRQNRHIAEWFWKFKSLNQSRILLAFDNCNDLVTHFAVLTDDFTYHGHKYISGHSVDIFSDQIPGAVRSRLFEKLVRQFFAKYGSRDDVSLMFGFPGTRARRLGRLKLDFGKAIPVKYWEKKVHPIQRTSWTLRRYEKINIKKVDGLWNRSKHRYPVSIIRNSNWIKKRYLSHPSRKYNFIKISQFSMYKCIGVYTINANKMELVDLIWDGKDPRDLIKLEKIISQKAAKAGISEISMWLSGDPKAETIFAKKSWECIRNPLDLHIVAKSFNSDIDRHQLLNKFYLTKGCSDII